jgi:hypothetical protein
MNLGWIHIARERVSRDFDSNHAGGLGDARDRHNWVATVTKT